MPITAVLSFPPVPVMRRCVNIQVHVASLAADEGFVNFDFAAQLAAEGFILQGQTNAMQHEPSGFLGNIEIASEFATS